MASTTNKTLDKPANGADVDTWDQPVNANSDIIDAALGNTTNINVVAASGTVALTVTQYRPSRIILSGLLTANVVYQFPATIGWNGTVYNASTGAFTITFSSAGAGTSIVIPQGASVAVSCDATNVYFTNNAASGSDSQVQYNKANVLAADSALTYNDSTKTLATRIFQSNGATSGNFTLKAAAISDSTAYSWPGTTASGFMSNDGAGNLTWTTASSGVLTFSAGTTGLTPSSPTGGAVVLAGTLATANGGTALTTFTAANRAIYSTSASVLTAGTLPVAAGGTGAITLTGVVIGNGTSAFTVKTNPSGAFVGDTDSQTLTNKTLTSPAINGATINAASTVSDSGSLVSSSVGFRGSPLNTQNGTYSTVASDTGKTIYHTSASAHTWTINNAASYADGAIIAFVIESTSGNVTLALSSGTLAWGSSTGSRTLGPNATAQAQRMTGGTIWRVTGSGIS